MLRTSQDSASNFLEFVTIFCTTYALPIFNQPRFKRDIFGVLNADSGKVSFESCACHVKPTTIDVKGVSFGYSMSKKIRCVLWVSSLVLIGNFIVLRMYGDTLRSTHLFIVRGTVFHPLAWLNLILGILLVGLLVWEWLSMKR